jgi:SAM-dependent MidA family methyltransferase
MVEPEPGADRLPTAMARGLADRIRRDGPLPFAVVMAEALYGPGGYYARERLPIGPDGDFVTGSSLSPLFGRATARVVERLDRELGRPADFLEVGPGGGEHLRAVAEALGGDPPRRILALDRIVRALPAPARTLESLADLSSLPPAAPGVDLDLQRGAGAIEGLVFSYELFDALPVHRLIGRADGSVGELWVALGDRGLAYVERELSDPALASLLGGEPLAPGQIADLAPGWEPLYRDLARSLRRGLIVTCDYGFERDRLLDPRVRRHGTLACHSRQRVHRDALGHLGEHDLTAHVDWTALRDAGEAAGLETVSLARQTRWLLAAGIFDDLTADRGATTAGRMLLDGSGMGEEIRVLVQSRGIDAARVLDRALLGGAPRPR